MPPDLDLNPLVGSRIVNIGLGLYNTCFSFEIAALHYGDINTEGRWIVLDAASAPTGGRNRDNDSSLGATPFADLLGATVESFSLSPPVVFELALSSGVRVRFYDDSDIYESVHIRPGNYVI